MESIQVHIALVSNDQQRIEYFCSILNDASYKIFTQAFSPVLFTHLAEQSFDLIIFDCYSNPEFDYRLFDVLRRQKKLENIPFVFILNKAQDAQKRQIYRIPQNRLLIEPLEKFEFISTIISSLHLGRQERSLQLYKDIVEGERQLISYMDQLLEISQMEHLTDEKLLFEYLRSNLSRRLELALAVETVLFVSYDSEGHSLQLNLFDKSGQKVLRRHTFALRKSRIGKLVANNQARMFGTAQLNDPLIQEIEESLGLKIFSLLFVPLSVFHEPKAAYLILNKLYRDEFTENDLAFGMIAAQKITYHMENIALKKLASQETLAERLFVDAARADQDETPVEGKIIHQVKFGTIVFDEAFRVIFANEAAFGILGREQSRDSFGTLDKFFGPEEFEHIAERCKGLKGPLVRQEIELRKHKIPHYYIGYSIYPSALESGKKLLIMVFSEISQTKRIQAEIVRMDRMASLGILSSGIAHEIRNPLAGIKAMAQTLEEEIPPDSIQLEYVNRILKQVNRLDDLLRAFFSYAKPVRPDPEACQIKYIISEVLPLVRQKMRDNNVSFEQSYQPDLADVFVDSHQIEQVFLNLFLNALDAMPSGGHLSVKAKNSLKEQPVVVKKNRVTRLLSGKYIKIHVTDNGTGMDQDVADKIFDPFFTTKSNGTGLGLSIVYQIVKEHGGHIDVNSTKGLGTEFIILLPANEKNLPAGN